MVAVVGLLGAAAVVGCSASGDTNDVQPATQANPTEGPAEGEDSSRLPASNPGQVPPSNSVDGAAPVADAGPAVKDAGKVDAAKDAGPPQPPPPVEGTPCAMVNQIFKRPCENCGTQEAVCLPDDSGTTGTVSGYGWCANQVVDACTPGAAEDVVCGNCGMQKRTCNNYCTWSVGACTGQPPPALACTKGSVELVSAGCEANLYREKTCKATCTWDNVSLTCSPPPSFVLVAPTVGDVASTIAVLSSTQTMSRMPSYGTCPLTTTTFPTAVTPYAYIEVRNTNPTAVTVSIYNSQAAGGPILDTVMAAYDGTGIPTTEAARRACKGGIGDYGTLALTGDTEFASLDKTKAVTIPANSSVQVYFATYSAYDASTPSDTTGMIKLNVLTDAIAP